MTRDDGILGRNAEWMLKIEQRAREAEAERERADRQNARDEHQARVQEARYWTGQESRTWAGQQRDAQHREREMER